MIEFDPRFLDILKKDIAGLRASGALPSDVKLRDYYRVFAGRFGPERLAALNGEPLLRLMHQRRSVNSLMYALESRESDEFAEGVGSIAGESRSAYGVYNEGATWLKEGLSAESEISLREAVSIAEAQRDEILRGCELFRQLPPDAGDEEYANLDTEIGRTAHSVSPTAWGHKYFGLIFPERLDHFHNPVHQRFHLIKALQLPPEQRGRYAIAARFVALAKALGVPISHLTTVLQRRNGHPHAYWRVLAEDSEGVEGSWELMQAHSCMAIGWPALGDLGWLLKDRANEDRLTQLLEQHYSSNARTITNARRQIVNFVLRATDDDVVVAADGSGNLGIARVKGEYEFVEGDAFPHRRKVEWLNADAWQMPESEALRTMFWQLMNETNHIEIERRLVGLAQAPLADRRGGLAEAPIVGRVRAALVRKGQVILYGPPGTGKTYWALRAAFQLSTSENPPGKVEFCTFHPGFQYSDFIEGLCPEVVDGSIVYRRKDGIFKDMCAQAEEEPNRSFYLVIDEINRGEVPRIFGELMSVIEKNKRSRDVLLPLSKSRFSMPENVYIIATMGTAVNAASPLDAALRRRFAFIELLPDPSVLGDAAVEGINLAIWLEELNKRIRAHVGRDARGFQLGHSYFLRGEQPIRDFASLSEALQDDIIPLLEEYCGGDFAALEKVLGPTLVDVEGRRVRSDLFEKASSGALIESLRQLAGPGVSAAGKAVKAERAALAKTR
ncbi:MAG TPA: AAA family ATPase [Alphaproteobacteria bacterium]|nr:AAA family ATPase [Alphaproteobacteria bacterium]